ncbi:hypothetical protein ACQGRJ_11625 [Bacillus atrophaeus]|uniref:hypothetical protein n=1 Tax=Bacillus atrophaeus TaxID=1452 RepID=UPI003CF7ED31
MLTKTKFKLKDKEAVTLCERGLKLARQLNNVILFSEFRFLKTLFTEDPVKELEDILKFLEDKEMLPDMEDLATDAAKYYKKMKSKVANVFYEKMLYAQKQIQRGDCLYKY